MSGIAELFKDILTNYSNEYSRNNKVSSPYFKELREKSRRIFKPLIGDDFRVKPIGGQGLANKSAYVAILAKNQEVSRGIYLVYFFNLDTKEVTFAIGDADKHPPKQDLVKKIGKYASQLLPDYEIKDDGYPIKSYRFSELNDQVLQADLATVLDVYAKCMSEFSDEIQEYTEQGKAIGGKKPHNRKTSTSQRHESKM